ncbi:MAG: hypothetical protein Q7S74_04785 [Nanoarchaeota archaeon]|nr:hypothetical protein [Nanoarchaeota archaeon]
MEETKQKLKVLVGDDQLGIEGSISHKSFLRCCGHLANFDFSFQPDKFIEKAKQGKYDALITDLNWTDEDLSRKDKTGFRVLEAIKNYAPIRVLHTSDDEYIQLGYQHGATHCLEKNRPSTLLEKILKGGGEKWKE